MTVSQVRPLQAPLLNPTLGMADGGVFLRVTMLSGVERAWAWWSVYGSSCGREDLRDSTRTRVLNAPEAKPDEAKRLKKSPTERSA